MSENKILWVLTVIGGWLGGSVPLLWEAGYFSFSSLFASAIGASIGILIAFKLTH